MRSPKLAALLAALALALAACGNGDVDEADDPAADEPETETEAADEPDPEAAPEPDPATVEEDPDLAATVDGQELTVAEVDERFAPIAEHADVEGQLEGEEGEAFEGQLKASIVSNWILTTVIVDGAAEMGEDVTDEDIEEARQELVDATGGQDEFDQAVADSGMTDEQIEEQLRGQAAINNVEEALSQDLDEPAGDEDADAEDQMMPSPGEMAVQQWIGERLAEAQVTVNERYGTWDPMQGQVIPEGGMMPPPMPEPEEVPPPEGEGAPTPEGDDAPAPEGDDAP